MRPRGLSKSWRSRQTRRKIGRVLGAPKDNKAWLYQVRPKFVAGSQQRRNAGCELATTAAHKTEADNEHSVSTDNADSSKSIPSTVFTSVSATKRSKASPMASISAYQSVRLPLRSRVLADPKAIDDDSEPVASEEHAKTPDTSASVRRNADLYPSEGSSDPGSPLPLFPEVDPPDPKAAETLKEVEKTAKEGPEALSYYWNTATFDWRAVVSGDHRKYWEICYGHIHLTDLARQMKALLDEYGLDHTWKRENPLLEFCIEHNFVIQSSFQPGNVDASLGTSPLSPGIVGDADTAIEGQPKEMHQWYQRAKQAAREPETLLKKAPPCQFGIRYGNPFARITQRDVLDWVTKNAGNFKAGTNWDREPLPQERILYTRTWLVNLRWARWAEAFPDSIAGSLSREEAKVFYNRTYIANKAAELVDQFGFVVLPDKADFPTRADFTDFKISYTRLVGEMCVAYQPLLIEKWRRFIDCCERIIDDEDKLICMKEARDRALSEVRSRIGIFEPPWASEWAALGFGGKAANIDGIYHLLTTLSSGAFGTTSLWVQYDESGRICDRIVTKDCQFQGGSEGSQLVNWGDSESGQLLHEAYFMRLLARLRTGSDYFPIIEYESQAIFDQAGGDAKCMYKTEPDQTLRYR